MIRFAINVLCLAFILLVLWGRSKLSCTLIDGEYGSVCHVP